MIDTSPDSWRWEYTHQEIQFYAWRNAALMMCRISREAIENRYGHAPTPTAHLQAARQHVDEIAERFDELLAQGRFEDDGSVLLRSSDW